MRGTRPFREETHLFFFFFFSRVAAFCYILNTEGFPKAQHQAPLNSQLFLRALQQKKSKRVHTLNALRCTAPPCGAVINCKVLSPAFQQYATMSDLTLPRALQMELKGDIEDCLISIGWFFYHFVTFDLIEDKPVNLTADEVK